MTSPTRHADRAAVFDRDERRCRHCGADGDDESVTLRTYPLGDDPADDAHESALVTVCDGCYATLESAPEPASMDNDDLFRLVRDTTGVQSATISDVAAFASLATSLPETIESAVDGTDADLEESIADYRRTRRDVSLALDVVDARLERIAALESAADPDVRSALAAFSETAADLQSDLRRAVELGETVATGFERCHGCFAALEASADATCATCGLDARETTDWQGADGTLAFDRLFATINETLQGASTTTETLTDRTMTLAERLTAESDGRP